MVFTTSIPGRVVAFAPISDHRTMPNASAAALKTLERSCVFCAPVDWIVIAATAAIVNVLRITGLIRIAPLVMFFGHDVAQIPLAARLRFRKHCIGMGIQQR